MRLLLSPSKLLFTPLPCPIGRQLTTRTTKRFSSRFPCTNYTQVMNRRSEPCRNFQRGSCQYGDRCKFLHVTQQQSRPNPFGFGSHSSSQFSHTSQQPRPNPFGFGVQDTSLLRQATNFGSSNQRSSMPFENKWIRQTAATKSTPSQEAENKKQVAEHECTDPESCKRLIAEDFRSEAPIWKLTSYGHWKYLPCDIVGDFSFEELRAAAYDDAKRGLPLQSSVERERNMLNSKISEFDNLLRNPYVMRSLCPTVVNQFPVSWNTTAMSPLSNKPPSFSSFTQLGASATVAPMSFANQLPGTPLDNAFIRPSSLKCASQNSGVSEMKFGTSVPFGGQIPMQQLQTSQGPSYSGTFSGQLPMRQSGSSTRPSSLGITNGFMAMGSEQHILHSKSPQLLSSNVNQSSGFLDWANRGQNSVNQAPAVEKQDVGTDDIIWSKEWDIGEIPEVAPPETLCFELK